MVETSCIRLCPDQAKLQDCKDLLTGLNGLFGTTASALNLAGNETRLKILYLLHAEHNLCVCDLSDVLGMSISAVSQHLRKMKDGGIIHDRKEGQTVFYSIALGFSDQIAVLLQPLHQSTSTVVWKQPVIHQFGQGS